MIPVIQFVHGSRRIDGNRHRIIHRGRERPQSVTVKAKACSGKGRDSAVAIADLSNALETEIRNINIAGLVYRHRIRTQLCGSRQPAIASPTASAIARNRGDDA